MTNSPTNKPIHEVVREKMDREALMEIVKKVQIDDGDVLICRYTNHTVIENFIEVYKKAFPENPKNFIVIHEDDLDIMKSVDEETMRELGWERIK